MSIDMPCATLHLGDCIEMMSQIDAGSIDMVLVDPPFGTTRNPWDVVIPFASMWPAIWRLCPDGAVVMFAGQPFSSELVMSQRARYRHEWIWEKNKATGHLNAKRQPMKAHEQVLVFSRGTCPYLPQMTDGHEPGHYAIRRQFTPNYGSQRPTEYGGSTQRYPRSVQKFPIINNDDPEKVHPTQKPVELCEYLIRTYAPEGGTVLDFTMGSGTTGVAAINTGRKFVGIESHPDYFEHARRRIESAMASPGPDQKSLFDGAAA